MSLNICLIKTPIIHQSVSFTLAASPPLGLAYIAGALRVNGHGFSIIDSLAEGCQVAIEFLDDLWTGKIYSNNISSSIIKAYAFTLLIIFYGSNYFFRPYRLLKTSRNITTQKQESRLEQILHNNFFKNSWTSSSLKKSVTNVF